MLIREVIFFCNFLDIFLNIIENKFLARGQRAYHLTVKATALLSKASTKISGRDFSRQQF